MVSINQIERSSSNASTAAQSAAKKRVADQQRMENIFRLAGTMRQEDILMGRRPVDVGTSNRTSAPSGGASTSSPVRRGGGGGFSGTGIGTPPLPTLNLDYAGDGKNVEQLRSMYASALAELQRQQAESGQTILTSANRMLHDPSNYLNAYEGLQAAGPNVVGNPLAEYSAATGISTDMANKNQQLATADAQAYENAVQNVFDIMSASQQAANNARMADIGMIETGANQDLATQANMLKLLLNQRENTDVIALQQRNLENAINQRNIVTQQIQSIFGKDGPMGGRLAPASIFELIEATLAKMNTSQWGSGATA